MQELTGYAPKTQNATQLGRNSYKFVVELPLAIPPPPPNLMGPKPAATTLTSSSHESPHTWKQETGRRRTPGPPLSNGTVASRPGTLPVASHTRTRPSSWPVKYRSLPPRGPCLAGGLPPPEKTHLHLLAVPAALLTPSMCSFTACKALCTAHRHVCPVAVSPGYPLNPEP